MVEYELDNNGNVVSEVVREGDLSHLVATSDGQYYAYARDGADVFLSSPSGGQLLTGEDAHPAGFADGLLVINERDDDGEPSIYLYDYLCDDEFEPVAGLHGVHDRGQAHRGPPCLPIGRQRDAHHVDLAAVAHLGPALEHHLARRLAGAHHPLGR